MLFRRNKAKAVYTEAQMQSVIQEAFEEATQSAERVLAIDGMGWRPLGAGIGLITEDFRRECVHQSRVLSRRDSMCKQLIRLWQDFGIGTGVTYTTEHEPTLALIDTVWKERRNACVFSLQGQREQVRTICNDGELFLAVFPGNPAIVRPIDSLEITDICVDPEDSYLETHYVREYFTATNERRKIIYKADSNQEDRPGVDAGGNPITASPDVSDVTVVHARLEGVSGRGDPLLMSVIEWALASRSFMQTRMAVVAEIGRIARKYKVDGSPAQVTAEIRRQQAKQAARTIGDNPERGTSFVSNAGVDTDITNQETGASSAQVDDAMILRRASAGASVFPHYLGAGEAFRLATATAMEPPMLRAFETFNVLIIDTYSRILEAILQPLGATTFGVVELSCGEIWPTNKEATIAGIAQAASAFPMLKDCEPLVKRVMTLTGVQNPDEVYDATVKAFADRVAQMADMQPGGKPGEPKKEEPNEADVVDILRQLKDACGGGPI